MLVRTPSDLGAIIRERRLKLGLDQLSLAKKAGTSRKWLIEVENGKPRAEFGLILRTLKALGIELAANPAPIVHERTPAKRGGGAHVDIDSILDSLKRRK
ncbi:MAG TPA: helix-turn-helix domain-containing protein [Candidatus Binataceae bacterium]|nr:helix-turn-helix domain-containing protein [Candidatus Binataceae bacterium]